MPTEQEDQARLKDLQRLRELTVQRDSLTAKKPSPVADFGQQFAGRGADFLESFSGPSRFIDKMLTGQETPGFRQGFGIPEKSDTAAGAAGSFAFDAALAAVPIGKAAQGVAAVGKNAGKIETFLRSTAQLIGSRFKAAPVKTVAAEGALGASAGAGGFLLSEQFPDTPGAQLAGELIGGAGPGIAADVTVGGAKLAGRGALKVAELSPVFGGAVKKGREFTTDIMNKARERARTPLTTRTSRRIDRATDDRPGALAAMNEDLARKELLTPAQQTGDVGLLSLERSVIESTDKLRINRDQQLSTLNDALKQDFVVPGDVSATKVSFEQELGYFSELTDQKLRSSMLLADERVSKLAPSADREAANKIVRTEVDSALRASSEHENMLFNKIDQDAVVITRFSQAAVKSAVAEMGSARSADVPAFAVKLLHPKGKAFTPITDVRELRGIQSRLRETSRSARADGKLNQARISDQIADAITDDISRIDGVGDDVRMAVGYSRYKNEVFRQGNVGKILGYVDTGEGRIAPGLTLETTLGASGTGRGREALDDIIQAAGTSPAVRSAMDDFVKDDFLTSTVRGGEFNKASAESYLANNKETLKRLPQIRDQIQGAIDANNAQAFTQRTQERINPKIGRATMFIREEPAKAFNAILSDKDPRNGMQKLINMAERDGTGAATQGLKSSYSQFILDSATDSNGVLSGEKLSSFLSDSASNGTMKALFSDSEFVTMTRIMRTAQRMDLARGAKASVEGITGEKLDGAVSGLARFIGAAYGRSLGTGTIQVPQIFANKAEDFARERIANPSRLLLIDAVQDEELFKAILRSDSSNDVIAKKANARLNAWTVGILTQSNQDEQKDN